MVFSLAVQTLFGYGRPVIFCWHAESSREPRRPKRENSHHRLLPNQAPRSLPRICPLQATHVDFARHSGAASSGRTLRAPVSAALACVRLPPVQAGKVWTIGTIHHIWYLRSVYASSVDSESDILRSLLENLVT